MRVQFVGWRCQCGHGGHVYRELTPPPPFGAVSPHIWLREATELQEVLGWCAVGMSTAIGMAPRTHTLIQLLLRLETAAASQLLGTLLVVQKLIAGGVNAGSHTHFCMVHLSPQLGASCACCRSEEQRLEISRALIDFQMETNEAKQEWANTK
jgi:hypothetical protein